MVVEKHRVGLNRKRRTILKAALIGAVTCAIILFFFGDGWARAFYLASEGIVIGGVVGGIVGAFLPNIQK